MFFPETYWDFSRLFFLQTATAAVMINQFVAEQLNGKTGMRIAVGRSFCTVVTVHGTVYPWPCLSFFLGGSILALGSVGNGDERAPVACFSVSKTAGVHG